MRRKGEKKIKRNEKRQHLLACEDEWFHILFYSFRRHRTALHSNITALTILFLFSSSQVAKDIWVVIVLIRSKMTKALSWKIAVN